MYYLFALLLFILLYYVFVKLLSSVIKGCFTAILVVFIILAVLSMIKSTKEPVEIFGIYRIDNFEITKIDSL